MEVKQTGKLDVVPIPVSGESDKACSSAGSLTFSSTSEL